MPVPAAPLEHQTPNVERGLPASAPPLLNKAQKPKLRYRIEYALLWTLSRLAGKLPLESASRLSGIAWQTCAPLTSRHRRAASHLAAMLPALNRRERDEILRAMWNHLGQTFIETILLTHFAAQPERLEIDAASTAMLRKAIATGCILVTPHLGNWEIAALANTYLATNHAVIYRPAKNPLTDEFLLQNRALYYRGGLFAKGHDAVRKALKHLRKGGSLGIMADLRDHKGLRVPFFGYLAPSTPMPAMLACQLQRPIFAMCIVRTGTCRFKMVTEEVPVYCSGDRAADVLQTTAAIQAIFEQWIRRWPEQWMWAHRRINEWVKA